MVPFSCLVIIVALAAVRPGCGMRSANFLPSTPDNPKLVQPMALKWRPFNLREEVGEPVIGSSRRVRMASLPPLKRWNPHPIPASSHTFDYHSSPTSGVSPLATAASFGGRDLFPRENELAIDDGDNEVDLGQVKSFVDGLKNRIRNEISLLLAVSPQDGDGSQEELRNYFGGPRGHTRKFLPLPLLRGGLTRH